MAMAEDKEVDVGMVFQIFFCKAYEHLVVLALEGRFCAILALQATASRPLQSEAYTDVRVQPPEEPLAEAAVEDGSEDFEAPRIVGQPIAMGQIEDAAIDFARRRGLTVNRHSAFLFEIPRHPKVVIPREIVNLHAHIGEFRDFSEEPREATRHHLAIFKPEVEHIAQEIHCTSLMLDAVKKVHKTPLLHSTALYGQRSQVGIAEEIHGFHNGRDNIRGEGEAVCMEKYGRG